MTQQQLKTSEDFLRDFTEVCREIAVLSIEEQSDLADAIAQGQRLATLRTDQLLEAGRIYIDKAQLEQGKQLMQGFLNRTREGVKERFQREQQFSNKRS